MTTIRPELAPLPIRMRALPLDARGYPVPWFVAIVDGVPEFRAMDPAKWSRAVREKRCWVCGQPLGGYLAFIIGPMCAISRTTAEPPNHLTCAEWSAENCPFLARPHAHRRTDAMTEEYRKNVPGIPLDRNPGVACVWTTRSYNVFRDGAGKPLIQVGDPTAVRWYAEGRAATRAEVEASITSGLPALIDTVALETPARRAAAHKALDTARQAVAQWLPSATI